MSDLHVVMYHYTRDLKYSRYPNIKGMEYKEFKHQLEFLCANFNIVSMEQVIEAWNVGDGQTILPERAMLLTFDDGYIDNYLYAFPVLQEMGVQGSFFIPGKTFAENTLLDVNKIHFILASCDIGTIKKKLLEYIDRYRDRFDYPENDELYQAYAVANRFDDKDTIFVKRILQTVLPEELRNIISSELFTEFVGLPEESFARELYMNADQIRTMKRNGMFIGLHGYDHYWLGKMEPEEMKKDIDKSLEIMEPFIDKNAWVLNYPYGNFNKEVLGYIELKGCKLGMTTEVRVASTEKDRRFTLPRLDCNDYPPKSKNYIRIMKEKL